MEITIERFDTDETIRVRNTPRATPRKAALPIDFPFLVDEETGEVVEPVLLHLASKFWGDGAGSVKEGRWRLRASADAAASDLKDWWTYLDEREIHWADVTEDDLGRYLKGLRDTPSERTGDFLADATYARRCASIEAFHSYAAVKWPKHRFPSLARAALGAGVGKRGPRSHRNEPDAHPISPTNVNRIAEHLGPLPSERGEGQSSRSRLAFEIGLNSGLRVDEVCNLRADTVKRLGSSGEADDAVPVRLKKTKGLVPRTVFVPTWLVHELKKYLDGEREEDVAAARRRWLGDAPQPPNLLLNRWDAPADPGKPSTTATIDKAFNAACMDLGITETRIVAEGTDMEGEAVVPVHTFHDCRHTFAYWTYLGLINQDEDPRMKREPWLFIQSRLGHADVATTIGTYLKVFDELGTPTLAALGRYFRNARQVIATDEEAF